MEKTTLSFKFLESFRLHLIQCAIYMPFFFYVKRRNMKKKIFSFTEIFTIVLLML